MQKIENNVKADLHTHTYFSDGKLSPDELISKAKHNGIAYLSVTDHDSVEAISECIDLSQKYSVEIIPGVELSSEYKGREVHVLGYFIDYKSPELLYYLANFRELRVKRAGKIIEKLNSFNIPITMNDVFAKAKGKAAIGRPHIAFALMELNVVNNYYEAFYKYLGDNKPAYVKKPNIETKDAVQLISKANGLSFIAHPGKSLRDEIMIELIEQGVDGIEIVHPSHTKDDVGYFQEVAGQYFLLESGGSDFHGGRMNDDTLLGHYYIPVQKIYAMKNRLFTS